MQFKQHYSGSKANLYEVIADNGQRLIIDPGVTWDKLLKAFDFKLSNVEACFVSHSHLDHCKALVDVQKSGIKIYASLGTLEALDMIGRNIHPMINKTRVVTDTFSIYCFDTIHDAPEPMGFTICERDTGEILLFVTDTKCIKQKFICPFSIVAIEASYNGEYLRSKVETEEINEALAKRLLDSHMEESETLRYLTEFCDLSQAREIHLLHLSTSNIHTERLVDKFEKELFLQIVTV